MNTLHDRRPFRLAFFLAALLWAALAHAETVFPFQFALAKSTVSETAGQVSVVVTRTGDPNVAQTVQYFTANGTATAGSDYTAVTGTLSFAAGDTEKAITVPILNDTLVENDETFTINLGIANSGTPVQGPVHTVVIQSDDVALNGIIAFAAASSSVGELDGARTVTIVRTGSTAAQETVQYATANGSATAGSDYTATSGTVTFAAGQREATISIPILDDSLGEANETFSIKLSNPGGGAVLGTLITHTVTIISDDPVGVIAFAQAASTVNEDAGSVTIAVVRSGDTTAAQSVQYATSPGTATAGSDYTTTTGTLTFDAGQTEKAITVPIINDTLVEADETFFVMLSTGNTAGGTSALPRHTVTIHSEDVAPPPGTVAFAKAASTVNEDAGSVTIAVVRSGNTTAAQSVQYGTANGTATAGSDYTATTGTLTFDAGQTEKTITVPIINDTLVEPDETFTVMLSTGTAAGATNTPLTHTVTIHSEDVAPPPATVAFAQPASTVNEDAGSVTITVVRSGNTTAAQSVQYGTANGTATAGSDYTATTGTLTFDAGQTEKTITVPIINDTLVEPDETFTVLLSTGNTAGGTSALPTHTVTIHSEDVAPPPPTVAFAQPTSTVGEAAGAARINVVRTGDSTVALQVPFATVAGTGAGAATPNVDYTPTSGVLSFAAGETQKTISVPILNDTTVEGNETFAVTLSPPSGTVAAGPALTHTVTILDDDVEQSIFAFAQPSSTVNEGAGTVEISVVRTGATASAASVSYHTVDGAGTATAGSDYTATSGTLTFAAGETQKTISVPILNDTITEQQETFGVALGSSTTPAGTNALTHIVTILDDDAPSTFSFAQQASTVQENAGSVQIRVLRGGNTANAASVSYGTPATGTATAGSDYTATTGKLEFAAGETEKTISVTILDDSITEPQETFSVVLGATAGTVGANILTHVVTIIDDDAPSTFSFAQQASTVQENAGSVQIRVLRGGNTANAASVSYGTPATGTATAGSDYTATTGRLEFAAGETEKTISVTILDDSITEPQETFSVVLSAPAGTAAANVLTHVVTIIDDDVPSTFSFAQPASTVQENAGSVQIRVLRGGNTANVASVSYGTANGTATAGSDFTATTGKLEFAAGETEKSITVPILNDTIHEEAETFTVLLANTILAGQAPGQAPAAPLTHTVTIQDDDTAVPASTIAFAEPSSTVQESAGNVQINVVRKGDTSAAASVQYTTVSNSTATATNTPGTNNFATPGTDYTTTSGTLTFAIGESSKTISVPILNDTTAESSESFGVALSAPVGGTLAAPNLHVVTILDDDTAPQPAAVGFALAASAVNESAGSVAVNVIRVGDASGAVSVQYATVHGTATAGSDYTETSGTLNFAANETTQTITVPIAKDDVVEGNETFQIVLSSPTGATLGPRATHTVTIVDSAPTTIAFESSTLRVAESTVAVYLRVLRSGRSDTAFSVHYAFTDGTAVRGVDYSAMDGDLNFAPGQTAAQIAVALIRDTTAEGQENFSVALSNPTNGAVLGANSTLTVTLTDEASAATYVGLATAAATGDQAFVEVTTSGVSTFSATVRFGNPIYRIVGNFGAGNLAGVKNFTTPNTAVAAIDYNFVPSSDGKAITGYVRPTASDDKYEFRLVRVLKGTATHPVATPGYYTAVYGNDAPTPVRGYLTAKVAATGAVVLSGVLPTGKAISESTSLTEEGDLILYFAPDAGRPAYLGGVAHLDHDGAFPFAGELRWRTDGLPAPFAGPPLTLTLQGAPFVRTTATTTATRSLSGVDPTAGQSTVTFTDANLDLSFPFRLVAPSRVIFAAAYARTVALNINPTTGVFVGFFVTPDGVRRSFRGACVHPAGAPDLMQGQFTGTTGPGVVEIVPGSSSL